MPGILVLLRHGQSTWNELNLFTGWHDVPLTPRGVAEATAAGTTMAASGLWEFRVRATKGNDTYTEVLRRELH